MTMGRPRQSPRKSLTTLPEADLAKLLYDQNASIPDIAAVIGISGYQLAQFAALHWPKRHYYAKVPRRTTTRDHLIRTMA
jgi:hypothetical protein